MFASRYSSAEVAVFGSAGDVLTIVDSSMRSRLDAALGETARTVHLDSVSAAISAVSTRPVRAVLVGPAAVTPDMSSSVLRLAGACAGSMLVAVISGWTPELPEKLLAFGRYGIRDAIDLTRREGLDRLRVLLTRPEWDLSKRIAKTILPSLELATEEMRLFVSHLIRVAPSLSSIKTLAVELQIRQNTMSSRFFRARLPSPKEYLATTRLLYASAVLETPRVSMAQVALRLNYSSPQSFGRHVRAQLGVSVGEFRERYSFDVMATHFANRLVFRHRDTLRWFEPLGRTVPMIEKGVNDSE